MFINLINFFLYSLVKCFPKLLVNRIPDYNCVEIRAKSIAQLLQQSNVCIYPTPPPQTGCNKRSIFKQSTAGLNSDFSF